MTAIPTELREELEKLERKHAENPEGRYFVPLANAFRKAGDVDRAIEVLRAGLAKHPDYLSAHIVMGRCLADDGNLRGAEAEFRQVLSLDAQNLIALRTLAELASAAGKIEDSRTWYQDLLAVDPMNEDARRALDALHFASAGDPAKAQAPASQVTGSAAAAADESAFGTEYVDRVDVEIASAPARQEHSDAGDSAAEPRGGGSGGAVLYGTMLDLDGGDEDPSSYGEESAAVVTETIAELYTRQGFYDRAANVYRELIRRRGSTAALSERLARVEALARGEGQQTVEGAAQTAFATRSGEHEGQPVDAPVDETGGEPGDGEVRFVPLADESLADVGAEVEVARPSLRTIRDYLREVASWAPSLAPSSSETDRRDHPFVAAELETEIPLLEVNWTDDPENPLEWEPESSAQMGDYDWAGGQADSAADAQDGGGGGLLDEDLFPWELPEEPAASAASEEGGARDPGDVADSIRRSDEAPRPGPVEADSDPVIGLSSSAEAPAGAESKRADVSNSATGDDDLQSFQEWLRSLKR